MSTPPSGFANAGQLKAWVLGLLSRPPSKAGLRLRSQRTLADRWAVDRNWVRRTFDELVAEGVLVQRHGSGTYLRRVPSPPDVAPTHSAFRTEDLFDHKPRAVRRALEPAKGALRIAVLTDLLWPAPTRRQTQAELVRQASNLGHRLDVVGVTSKAGLPVAPEALDLLVPVTCDAFLVHDDVADALRPLLERLAKPYVVYDALDTVRHQPTVVSNLDEAVERAVAILAAEGWHAIGLLGYAGSRNADLEQFRYLRGLRRADRPACPRMETTTLQETSIRSATGALLDQGTDALYVADDNLLPAVAKELRQRRLRPGRDIGVITMASHSNPLPGRTAWSRMTFDPAQFAQRTLHVLLAALQRADSPTGNLATLLLWEPGDTHRHTSTGA